MKRSFGRYSVEVTNPDKIIFPDDDITKKAVIDYYAAAGATLLRHIRDRPVSMHRYPGGIDEQGFYQKQVGEYFPEWLERARVEKEGGHVEHPVCTNVASVVYLAQLGTITPHVWLSRRDAIRQPDQIVFDLDPSDESADFTTLRDAASILKALIEDAGMAAFAMVTGSSGVHVRTPIRRGPDFDAVRAWAGEIAHAAVAEAPELLTGEMRIAKREGRIFVDVLRNAYAQTAVPPYALRARAGAPVSMPVTWDELESVVTSARHFNIRSALTRIEKEGDIWKDMYRHARSLPTSV
jgi:bifunctional non-homologous end joining protein LigD